MSISHYLNDEGCSPDWLRAMIDMETEEQWSPAAVQTNFSRVVSRDAVQGSAPMECEAVPA